jgi:DNA-binding response OmpR family regulator
MIAACIPGVTPDRRPGAVCHLEESMMNNLAMVIEDDVDLSNIFAEAIKASGFEAEVVRDGALAQWKLKESAPKIVVLDMHLPHVDGAALLAQIRADASLKGTTIIITTADALMADMYREQADFVLIKPITFTQLRDLTSRLRPEI